MFVSRWRLHAGGETARLAMSLAIWRGEEEEEEGGAQAEIKSEDPHLSGGEDGTNMDL